jgi:predicted nucleic acid-binding protein
MSRPTPRAVQIPRPRAAAEQHRPPVLVDVVGAAASLVRSAGRNPRPRRPDLQIAATAAAARVPLLTTNPADFTGLERLVTVLPAAHPVR